VGSLGFDFGQREILYLQSSKSSSGVHQVSYPMGTRALSSEVK